MCEWTKLGMILLCAWQMLSAFVGFITFFVLWMFYVEALNVQCIYVPLNRLHETASVC